MALLGPRFMDTAMVTIASLTSLAPNGLINWQKAAINFCCFGWVDCTEGGQTTFHAK